MKLIRKITRGKVVVASVMVLFLAFGYYLGNRAGTNNRSSRPAQEHAEKSTIESTVWTCSMHPQIKLPKPGQCPICSMDLIPLETGSAAQHDSHAPQLTLSENAKILAGIQTAPVIRRGASTDIRMVGKVSLDETRMEMITARFGGRIDRLFVDYTGVPVKKGDHLAKIYSPELISLQRELLEASRADNKPSEGMSELVQSSIKRTFTAAKEKLRLLGFSEAELQAILSRGTISDHMTIRTSQRGVVIKKLVEEGMYVKTGTPLFHIADLRKLWVKLDAYESDLKWLRLGQKVEFMVEAYAGEMFHGTISFIDPVVDPATRTIKIRVITGNKDNRLKPDMFVKAVVKAAVSRSGKIKNPSLKGKWISPMHPQIVKNKPGTCDICGMPLVRAEELGYVTSGFEDIDPLLIPATAPLFTGKRAVVYVELDNTEAPTYEGRNVVLGPRVGNYYIVKSGLTEGERVVINGAYKIDGELQILAKPSVMNPQGGVAVTGHANHGAQRKDKDVLQQVSVPDISAKPVSKHFTMQINTLINHYVTIAKALAEDDMKNAKKRMAALKPLINKVHADKGKQYGAWRTASKELTGALEHAHHITDLKAARTMFEKVSKQVITLKKHYGSSAKTTHYLAFCPMALNKKGAYWLQDEKGIMNPYYGKKMLKCGEIRETFKKAGK